MTKYQLECSNDVLQKCIDTGIFPDSWKYANVQPVHKKNNRQIKSNYRPISLLPTCGKLLEKIVFEHVYPHRNAQNLLSRKQSGFQLYINLFHLHPIFMNPLKNMMNPEQYF